MPEEEQTSPYQEPVERFQTKEQRAAEISSRTAFRSGKALAQKQFDRKFSAAEPKDKGTSSSATVQTETPQITRAKQKFRQVQAKKQTERRQGTAAIIEKHEAAQVQADIAAIEQQVDLTSFNADMPRHTEQPQNGENHPPQCRKRKGRAANSYSRGGKIPLSANGRRQRRRHRSRREPSSGCSSRSCRKPHKRQHKPANAQ